MIWRYNNQYHSGRENITTTLYDREREEDPPEKLAEFIAWAEAFLEKVPEKFRAVATIEIGSTSDGYDGYASTMTISYSRPETDAEWSERVQGYVDEALQEQAQAEANERAAYDELKKKYG